ncbi:MAG: transglutaminase-like domain-containing protein [Syntrophomonas sp.]|nr:transglutaminase-like domain-containing protein [Syntrophomonas sp.]
MADINFITLMIVVGFAVPIITGALESFTRSRIKDSVRTLLNNLELLVGLVLAIYLTRRIFFENEDGIFGQIYSWIPASLQSLLLGQDILIYILTVPLLLLVIRIILRLITVPIYKGLLEPLANQLYTLHNSRGKVLQRVMGGLYQLPRAIILVFLLGLLLNFFAYYFPSPLLSGWMNESTAYQLVYKNAVSPALNSNIAKKIPVLVNDSFGKVMERTQPIEDIGPAIANHPVKIDNPYVITYFNGVTLDEAIKSNAQIDATARQVVGSEQNSKKKAYLLYKWVSRNIEYDYNKAALISQDSSGIASGSIIAFNTRTGICFDYSSLYISMCRAAGLKVRLISGLGYSGVAWGDHAWNQVYSTEESRWINVDTTFGTNGSYFDKRDFNVDHRYAQVQGEW